MLPHTKRPLPRFVPRFLTLPAPLDDPLLDLQELVAAVHGRMRRIEASIGCISVLAPSWGEEGLKPYLKDNLNAWELHADGHYQRCKPGSRQSPFSAQTHLMDVLGQ